MSVYGNIQTQVQQALGNRSDTDTNTIILSSFNHVQKMLARSGNFPELEVVATPTLVSGTADYTVSTLGLARFRPPHIYKWTLLASGEYRPINFYTANAWEEKVVPMLTTSPTGKPTIFTYYAKTFSLYPTPDSNYSTRIRYKQYPLPAVDVNTVLQFDDADEILWMLTTAYVFAAIEDFDSSKNWFMLAGPVMAEMGLSLMDVPNFKSSTSISNDEGGPTGEWWKDPFAKESP